MQENGEGLGTDSAYLILRMDLLFEKEEAVTDIIDYLNTLDTVLWVEKRCW